MPENPLERFLKKLDEKTGMDNIDVKDVFFRLEQLIGKKFAEITGKEDLKQSLSSAVIPIELWKAADFAVLPSDINTPKGIDALTNFIYSQVLIHRILELPFTEYWEKLADEKVGLNDEEIIKKFWEGVEKYKVDKKEAIEALGQVGIMPDTHPIFEVE